MEEARRDLDHLCQSVQKVAEKVQYIKCFKGGLDFIPQLSEKLPTLRQNIVKLFSDLTLTSEVRSKAFAGSTPYNYPSSAAFYTPTDPNNYNTFVQEVEVAREYKSEFSDLFPSPSLPCQGNYPLLRFGERTTFASLKR